jgi:hypothetical protein
LSACGRDLLAIELAAARTRLFTPAELLPELDLRLPVLVAARLADGVEPRTPLHKHALCAARAALTEEKGEHQRAAELYAEANARWQQFGNLSERGHALLGWARCLLASNQPGAETALREARQIFSSFAAEARVDETDALLEHAAAESP